MGFRNCFGFDNKGSRNSLDLLKTSNLVNKKYNQSVKE